MKDLYLKIEEREILIDLLAENGITMEGNYFQNELLIIDWIGKIPIKAIETGDVIVWDDGGETPVVRPVEWTNNHRFNVRLIDESIKLFDEFESLFPEMPFRIFS